MSEINTYEQALAAGYTPGTIVTMYRGFCIRRADVSGGNSFGYTFALVVRIDQFDRLELDYSDVIGLCHDEGFRPLQYARTTSLWLKDGLNQLRKPGSFAVLFAPEDWQRGMDMAKAAIDRWMDEHPEVAARQAAIEQEIQDTHERQARRWTERQAQRAERKPLVHLVQVYHPETGSRVVPAASLDNARREFPGATQLSVFTFC
jgi:hypothetical protein